MAKHIVNKETVFAFWAVKDSTGVYPYGTSGSISQGAGSMMERARAFQTLTVNQEQPELKTVRADGGVFHTYRAQPTVPVSGDLAFLTLSQDLSTVAVGTTLYTEGQHSIELVANSCITFAKIALLLNTRIDEYDDSTGVFTSKWMIQEFLDSDAFPLDTGQSGDPSQDAPSYNYAVTLREGTKSLYGETFTTGNYGRTKGFKRRYTSANPVIYGAFVGNNSLSSYAIDTDYDPVAAASTAIQMWDDGTEQAYGTDAGEFELDSSDNQQINFATAPGTGSIHVFKLEFDGSAC